MDGTGMGVEGKGGGQECCGIQ